MRIQGVGAMVDKAVLPPAATAMATAPEAAPTAIVVDNLAVRRGGVPVLRGVSLTIPQGLVTAVVGRSGVGKTTLLGVLNGLVAPEHGTVTVAGSGPLDDAEALARHRRRTATVFQDHALIDRLTALDNVLLGLADTRHPLSPLPWPRALRRRAAEALDLIGLLPRALVRAGRLSGGERQRVGIARALIRKPDILLGDEPFASVDPALVAHLGRVLRQAVERQGVTAVLVLHQIETAMALADRIVGLAEGRVVFDGPATAFDAAARTAVFGPRPILSE
ncbi:phosphonate transport system ATP-binding protein [Azospirillum baldaniorum]|uniref:phosphonate ABC transporter ATP-binding protein n=1 Tax=Azospirillum baldaniorum TaxID=1064539 RepID=UPI0011AD4596|nr:ATP-binding cassette domain-containing protein [Azospirillum baldaniorum]TWA56444.1 phosphonate transport system ATP-binding protein [Azospirillum baldaniorum]